MTTISTDILHVIILCVLLYSGFIGIETILFYASTFVENGSVYQSIYLSIYIYAYNIIKECVCICV